MIKFALGENVTGKNDPGSNRYPHTRLGVETIYRRAFADARDYMRKQEEYTGHRSDPKVAPPRRDLRLETLADILKGNIWVNCHSYRQDEMLMMVRLSQEFKFHLVLHHALEGYKIAPELAQAKVPVTMFGDGFAYKVEVLDSIPMGPSICDREGVLTSVNTDSFSGMVTLGQDAGKQVRYGTTPDRALRMVTINPAIQIGVDTRVGSLEVGKDGDVAIWQGDPLSVYSKCELTLIDGEVVFQRRDQFGVDPKSMSSTGLTGKKYSPDDWIEPKASASYMVVGATIHPVALPDIANASILIQDGKIVKVGWNLAVPSGTTKIDGKGLDVYPGFIDGSSQLGLNEVGSVSDGIDNDEFGDFHPDLRAVTAVNPDSVHFPESRMNGMTSTAITPLTGEIAGQGSLISCAGGTTEQLAILDRCFLTINMPERISGLAALQLSADELKKRNGEFLERVREIREYLEAGKRYLAAKAAGENVATDVKLEALAPYLEGKLPVVFRASQARSIRQALTIAKDMGLKAIIGGGAESWKVRNLLAQQKVPVILDTPAAACPDETEPKDNLDPYDSPFAVATLLHDAGVQFCFESMSSDMEKNLPYGVGRMCAFGLSHDAAIKALTLDAAAILGVDKQLGSLEPGKVANIILTDGDPLDVSTSVKCEFINGQPVKLESHFTDLYRQYGNRLPLK